MLVLV